MDQKKFSQLFDIKFHKGGNECYNEVNPENVVAVR